MQNALRDEENPLNLIPLALPNPIAIVDFFFIDKLSFRLRIKVFFCCCSCESNLLVCVGKRTTRKHPWRGIKKINFNSWIFINLFLILIDQTDYS